MREHRRHAVVHVRAVQRLGRIADVVREYAGRRDEVKDVAVTDVVDHVLPQLPDAEGERALLRPNLGRVESVEVRLPDRGGDAVRVVVSAREE